MANRAKVDLIPYEKLNLVKKCLKLNANISILLNSLYLIEKGFIKTDEQLSAYLSNRTKSMPKYSKDVELIGSILKNTLF